MVRLNSDNFILYAMKMYNSSSSTGLSEFYEDINRIKYVKRLLIKYKKNHDLKERLILNHIIILQNVNPVGPKIVKLTTNKIKKMPNARNPLLTL